MNVKSWVALHQEVCMWLSSVYWLLHSDRTGDLNDEQESPCISAWVWCSMSLFLFFFFFLATHSLQQIENRPPKKNSKTTFPPKLHWRWSVKLQKNKQTSKQKKIYRTDLYCALSINAFTWHFHFNKFQFWFISFVHKGDQTKSGTTVTALPDG